MQSRRDHLQAYQFAVERLVRAALVGGRPGGQADAPLRRSGLGVSIGVVIAVLLCGGSLVYGLISPTPSESWRNAGAIIVDQSTGTDYLLLGGELRPTANYASALLATGQDSSVQVVPGAQLKGIAVGPEIGIAGAPSDVPGISSLLPGGWALCSRRDGSVVLDLAPAAAPGPAGQRVYVASTGPNPAEFLVWDSVKYPLTEQAVLPALGFGDQQPSPVDPAWLAALPTGPAVVAPAVAHLGEAGPAVDGAAAPVGTLFGTESGGTVEDYVLLAAGLAPITRTEMALFEVAGRPAAQQISTAAVAAAEPPAPDRSLLTALPDFLSGPEFGPGTQALCVRQTAPGAVSGSQVVMEPAATVAADPAVVLPANSGMLVEPPGQSPYAADPVIYLITDTGERYQVRGSDALDALGYASVPKVIMPLSVLRLIPAGPALDVDQAAQAVTWK